MRTRYGRELDTDRTRHFSSAEDYARDAVKMRHTGPVNSGLQSLPKSPALRQLSPRHDGSGQRQKDGQDAKDEVADVGPLLFRGRLMHWDDGCIVR